MLGLVTTEEEEAEAEAAEEEEEEEAEGGLGVDLQAPVAALVVWAAPATRGTASQR